MAANSLNTMMSINLGDLASYHQNMSDLAPERGLELTEKFANTTSSADCTPNDNVVTSVISPLRADDGVFTLFQKLPTELQLKIWGHAIINISARALTIEAADVYYHDSSQAILVKFQAACTTSTPSVLQACSVSRREALKIYHLSFADRLKRPIYFDANRDALLFKDVRACQSFVRSHNPAIDPALWLAELNEWKARSNGFTIPGIPPLKIYWPLVPIKDVRYLILTQHSAGIHGFVNMFPDLKGLILQKHNTQVSHSVGPSPANWAIDRLIRHEWAKFQIASGGKEVCMPSVRFKSGEELHNCIMNTELVSELFI